MEIGIFVLGLIAGVMIHIIFSRKKSSGTFVIDFSDPMKDIWRLELSEDFNSIYKKKRVIFDICTIENDSLN